MTKRGVPGVWTYGFYDGWTPNYMFFIAHSHNAIGRFYEVQSYGPDNYEAPRRRHDHEPRVVPPEPAAAVDQVGPAQQHQHPAVGRAASRSTTWRRTASTYLENYWLKNKRAVDEGQDRHGLRLGDPRRPAPQGRGGRRGQRAAPPGPRGAHARPARSRPARVDVAAGDYVIRADQPYRTMADMYFALQNFAPANPRPYDDTGWTFQLMRNVTVTPVTDTTVFDKPMTLLDHRRARRPAASRAAAPVLVVDHTTDNNLDDVPLRARARADAGGRGGLRGRRDASSAPARSSSRAPTARRSSRTLAALGLQRMGGRRARRR